MLFQGFFLSLLGSYRRYVRADPSHLDVDEFVQRQGVGATGLMTVLQQSQMFERFGAERTMKSFSPSGCRLFEQEAYLLDEGGTDPVLDVSKDVCGRIVAARQHRLRVISGIFKCSFREPAAVLNVSGSTYTVGTVECRDVMSMCKTFDTGAV